MPESGFHPTILVYHPNPRSIPAIEALHKPYGDGLPTSDDVSSRYKSISAVLVDGNSRDSRDLNARRLGPIPKGSIPLVPLSSPSNSAKTLTQSDLVGLLRTNPEMQVLDEQENSESISASVAADAATDGAPKKI